MAETPQPAPRRRRTPVYFDVAVSRVQQLTPRMVRVTFTGESLVAFATHGVAEHLKVAFPAGDQDRPVMPTWTDDGPVYQDGVPRPILRTYTPRRFRPDVRELDIEFALHPGTAGVAATWAAQAKVGDHVVVTSPGGPYAIDPAATDFVLAGDESAIPAIGQILEALPAEAHARVLLEVDSVDERQDLGSVARADVDWLVREPGSEKGRTIEAAIRELSMPSETRYFVACEAGVMRDIRRDLLTNRGLPREQFHTHGYWKKGAANHPDHDLGDD